MVIIYLRIFSSQCSFDHFAIKKLIIIKDIDYIKCSWFVIFAIDIYVSFTIILIIIVRTTTNNRCHNLVMVIILKYFNSHDNIIKAIILFIVDSILKLVKDC